MRLKNLKLGPKLIISFIIVTVLGILAAAAINQIVLRTLTQESIPLIEAAGSLGVRARELQSETLEYVALGDEEALDSIATTVTVINQLSDEIEASAVTNEVTDLADLSRVAHEMVPVSGWIIASHTQTLDQMDDLEFLEGQAELAVTNANAVIQAEVDRSVAADDLVDLVQDALPSSRLLGEYVVVTQRLRSEAVEFVATGEEENLEDYAALLEELTAIQAELENTLEEDEPGEALLQEQLTLLANSLVSGSQAVLDSHTNTLDLLEELEELETELNEVLATTDQAVRADVRQSIAEVTNFTVVGAAITLILSVGLGLLLARGIIRPVTELQAAAARMEAGDLSSQADVRTGDEIGALATAFNSMARQLQASAASLRERIRESERQNQIIQTSAEVSRQLATIVDEKELLSAVVSEVQRAFNYYHVHIYMLDKQSNKLKLAGGTGEAGQYMMARGHNLDVGQGLVGQAARDMAAVLVPDVTAAADWLANPLLPETKAETAVPILMGDELLGILDVQHNMIGGLNQSDMELLESLASQIGVALQNVRNLARSRDEAAHENLINSIGQKLDEADSVKSVMQVAVRELGHALGARKTAIRLLEDTKV
ncbi:MAG: GAF domain-containing protein [Ardenticatenales bacterium]|nr:GAF domain-containing protein [Ardenticatenales bacterium]